MGLTVVVPYRPRKNHDSGADLDRVLASIPVPVVVSTYTQGPWNRARALNLGIAEAQTDIVFCNDADCMWTRDISTDILGAVLADKHVVYRVTFGGKVNTHGAGMQGYRRSWGLAWDEAYEGYGREDIDMLVRARKQREVCELSGGIVHLDHPREESSPEIAAAWEANKARFAQKHA